MEVAIWFLLWCVLACMARATLGPVECLRWEALYYRSTFALFCGRYCPGTVFVGDVR